MLSKFIEMNGVLEERDTYRSIFRSWVSFPILLYFIVVFTIFGWVVVFWALDEKEFLSPHFVEILIISVIFSILHVFLIAYYTLVEWRKIEQPLCKYQASDSGINVDSAEFQSQIQWEYFTDADERSFDFSLSTKDRTQLTLPKRFFKSPEQTDVFRELLRAKGLLKG